MDRMDRTAFTASQLRQVEEELAEAQELLAAAPPWYRPRVPPRHLGPDAINEFRHLERVREARDSLRVDRTRLRSLLDELRRDPRRQERCYLRALDWINEARSWRDLMRDFEADPAAVKRRLPTVPVRGGLPLEEPRRLARLFAAILEFRDSQRGGKLQRLEDLRKVRGVTDELLASFVYTGCRLLAPAPQPPQPAVAVLQPARLETRFDPPAAAGGDWKMRLRIVPDDVVFDRFDPLASQEELTLVERLWRSSGGDLNSKAGAAAWEDFVRRVGGARAAWLAREFPMVTATDGEIGIDHPAQTRDEPYYGVPRGLPDEIEIWMGRGGAAPVRVATLTLDRQAVGELDLPDLAAGERRWWTSFAVAEAAGLGTTLDLGPQADDIDVLLAVGVSAEAPDDWFTHHIQGGGAALLEPGTPTNTVEGAPAAALDAPASWWRSVAQGQGGTEAGAVALAAALTGDPGLAQRLLGADVELIPVNNALVRALWYPLWGYAFKDVFGMGANTHLAGVWAAEALLPEGMLPALRVGTQPYGLLPVVPLDLWQADGQASPFEIAAIECLRAARDEWAQRSDDAGTVVGADTDRLLDLIGRVPTSDAWSWRAFFPLELAFLFYIQFGAQVSWSDLLAHYEDWVLPGQEICQHLGFEMKLVSFTPPFDMELPLVQPTNLSEEELRALLKRFADPQFDIAAVFAEGNGWVHLTGGPVPDSLLVRLLAFAHWLAAAELTREQNGITDPTPLAICWNERVGSRIERDASGWKRPGPGPAETLRALLDDACGQLADMDLAEVERAMVAVLDTASHRLDPWLTGYAIRRLQSVGASWPRRLGIYGWVDAPSPGQPGPTEGGLLHAPSQAQAYTAMILRDHAISDPEPGRWDMDLDSAAVRRANWMGEAVRAGSHIAEAIGAEVERIVGVPDDVDTLREMFPLRPEHGTRRVCDGVAVLAANPMHLPVAPAALAGLDELRAAVDAYGDLLVAQAVHHVVSGRGEIAGSAMDAAAGLAQPPILEVIDTPRTGRTVATTMVAVLPDAAGPVQPGIDDSPTSVADAAVVAWLEAETGAANSTTWSFTTGEEGGPVATTTLADAGLRVGDAVVLSREVLAAAVSAAAGAPARDVSSGFASHRRARTLLAALGAEPGLPRHLVTASIPDPVAELAELRNRLGVLLNHATQVATSLTAAVTAAPPMQDAALRRALRWGISALAGAELSPEERLTGAATALQDRIAAVPAQSTWPDLSATDVARHIAELAAGDARWQVLSRIDVHALSPGLTADERHAGAVTNPVDDEWLAVVASVREPLARVEAAQLEGALAGAQAPLAAWTNRPGDPWQQAGTPDPDTGRLPDSRLIVAYGPAGALDGVTAQSPTRAVALIDAFSEIVPEAEHGTSAGFGFNAPAARAPQAILLGVPPAGDGVLTDGDLAAIVLEARKWARVRVATPADLHELAAFAPTMMLPLTQPGGVTLEKEEDR